MNTKLSDANWVNTSSALGESGDVGSVPRMSLKIEAGKHVAEQLQCNGLAPIGEVTRNAQLAANPVLPMPPKPFTSASLSSTHGL